MVNTSPFIKLFKTPLGYYCYDVNTFSMLRITEGMYKFLNENNEFQDEDTKSRVKKLEKSGYLSSHKVKEIIHPYADLIEVYLAHNVRKITLQITQNCNLACKYCAYANDTDGKQRRHTSRNMPIQTAKKGINFLFEHSGNEEEINIGFYGGEPLLEFKKLKVLIDYSENIAKSKSKELSFSITTNATLLNDEMIEYFMGHNIKLLISLDGPEDIHNKNRIFRNNGKGSFSNVINKIENIKNKYPGFLNQVSINAVLDTENDFTCYQDFFTSYETFNEFKINTNIINNTFLQKKYKYEEQFKTQYKYEKFKLFAAALKIIDKNDVSDIVKKELYELHQVYESFTCNTKLMDSFHHGGPCIAGSTRLFIDVNGIFFPCERCSEKSSVMKIGDVNNGFNIEAAKRVTNIGKLTEQECINCWNILLCSLCATRADNITELSKEVKLKSCKGMKRSTENKILDYLFLREYGYDFNEL